VTGGEGEILLPPLPASVDEHYTFTKFRRCLIPADGFYEWLRHEAACVIVRRVSPDRTCPPVYMHGNRPTRKTRTISAAGRKRIAAAQRARWAKIKGQKVVSIFQSVPARDAQCPGLLVKGLPQSRKRAGQNGEQKRRPRLAMSWPTTHLHRPPFRTLSAPTIEAPFCR
jgi:hypothetical protein